MQGDDTCWHSAVSSLYRAGIYVPGGLLIPLRQLPETPGRQPDPPTFPGEALGHSCASLLANAQSLLFCHIET